MEGGWEAGWSMLATSTVPGSGETLSQRNKTESDRGRHQVCSSSFCLRPPPHASTHAHGHTIPTWTITNPDDPIDPVLYPAVQFQPTFVLV